MGKIADERDSSRDFARNYRTATVPRARERVREKERERLREAAFSASDGSARAKAQSGKLDVAINLRIKRYRQIKRRLEIIAVIRERGSVWKMTSSRRSVDRKRETRARSHKRGSDLQVGGRISCEGRRIHSPFSPFRLSSVRGTIDMCFRHSRLRRFLAARMLP